MNDEKVFAKGLIVKRHDNAPDFVICGLSIKGEEFVPFLREHQKDGWVNIQVKRSQGGKLYAELDTWEPNKQETPPQHQPAQEWDDSDAPF